MMFIVDKITGRAVFDTPVERARQKAEEVLLKKGYSKDEIIIDHSFRVDLEEGFATAIADILVRINGKNAIVIMCSPPTALTPYERLALACARVLNAPIAVATEIEKATILDTYSGKVIGSSLDEIPSRSEIKLEYKEIPEDRIKKEKRILITYLNILHCVGCRIERQ